MVSTRSSISLFASCALVLNGNVDADTCEPAYHVEVAAAVQTLHASCAIWAGYLARDSVWQCDSTCQKAVTNLVDTLPDCEWGGPYGVQNYKNVVEQMVARCKADSEDVNASTTSSSNAQLSGIIAPITAVVTMAGAMLL
ncbi:Ganglioside-induced differentiation-associated protein 2 [Phytophthora boehmeriae]|uniref:Ganglioside-induced differentiation-associated protein 2 n=1 Tax=Phytophthora boehmeriae TaxID=109152 RepID=A0A8T1VQF2_9STRA|nr:Ganglioside-induced differentiation-associated protein 2 [Phytophthora boehmeriae]